METTQYNFRNAVYNRHGTINCEIEHPVYGWIPFTAAPDDIEPIGNIMFQLTKDVAAPYVPELDPLLEIIANEEQARADIVISRLQAKAILAQYGMLENVEAIVAQQDFIVQLAWKEAVEFRLFSPTIQALKGVVKWPDGTDITDEDWATIFTEAQQIVF